MAAPGAWQGAASEGGAADAGRRGRGTGARASCRLPRAGGRREGCGVSPMRGVRALGWAACAGTLCCMSCMAWHMYDAMHLVARQRFKQLCRGTFPLRYASAMPPVTFGCALSIAASGDAEQLGV